MTLSKSRAPHWPRLCKCSTSERAVSLLSTDSRYRASSSDATGAQYSLYSTIAAASRTTEEIADAFRTFGAAGFTRLELMISPQTSAALDAMAPVLELLASD